MIPMLPLAGIDGWIVPIVVFVIMIISAISQIAGKKDAPPPRPQQRPRPRPPVRPAQAGAGRQEPVARELEEFLRRAAGGQHPARRPPPPGPVARPVAAKPAAARPAVGRPVPARPVPGRPVVAQPVAAEAVDELEVVESVADHVNHSVGGLHSQLELREGHGDRTARQFEHELGQLDSREAREVHAAALAERDTGPGQIVSSLPPTAAAGLAAMLASPTSLRQAILLREIIERPEQRWS